MPICPGSLAAVSLFHSLAEPTRLAIVRQLQGGEARVRDLVETLGLAQSTVSEHVACLRDCGLVEGRIEGRQVFYALARPELMDLLEAAEVLLAATGYKVDLCSVHGSQARRATAVRASTLAGGSER
ncbi:MAG: winged helix-turn-helix transcriptional regulator [Cryobacterium sp.]|nr:winged helix-turn-helix transcriptional regulator [Cryobacterium sp.]